MTRGASSRQNLETPEKTMRLTLNVIGGIFLFMGGVWFLQGINVLPGSFMTGQRLWAIIGGATILGGVILIVLARRVRRS
jgi:uncharacterized membrane protein HdeD (DUF308 family)